MIFPYQKKLYINARMHLYGRRYAWIPPWVPLRGKYIWTFKHWFEDMALNIIRSTQSQRRILWVVSRIKSLNLRRPSSIHSTKSLCGKVVRRKSDCNLRIMLRNSQTRDLQLFNFSNPCPGLCMCLLTQYCHSAGGIGTRCRENRRTLLGNSNTLQGGIGTHCWGIGTYFRGNRNTLQGE